MKLIYFAKEPWEQEYLARKLPGVEARFVVGTLAEHASLRDEAAEALCVFVDSPVGKDEMDRFPSLKCIATRSTGFDHIDLAEAKRRGITVVNVPSYGAPTVAEFAFALLLALSRKVCDAHARVASGAYSQEGLEGFDLMGKTMGIIGLGNIGAHVARIARGFGMQPLVHDHHRNDALAAEVGFTYADLPALFAQSDVISIHVPYTPQTRHLINERVLSQIKKGCYLINTARGGVVDTAALIKGLEDGTFAGAGLDVLEEEGDLADETRLLFEPHPKQEEMRVLLENHYLIEHPRVIVTPHVAFDTREAVHRILDTASANMVAFAQGAPQNVVQP